MSTSALGTVVGGDGNGIAGLTVVLEDVSALFDRELARGVTTADGAFSLTYAADTSEGDSRQLRLRIRVGQHVVKEDERDDVSSAQVSYGQIKLKGTDGTSVLATLGTGEPSRLSHGNALEWLCDDVDGWDRVASLIKDPGLRQLYIMQLQLDVGHFSGTPTKEEPKIVLGFDPPSMTKPDGTVRELTNHDASIEHLLLDATKRGATIRMQFPAPTPDIHGLATVGLSVGLGLGLTIGLGLGLLALGIVASLVPIVLAGFVGGAVLGALALSSIEHFVGEPYKQHANELSQWFTDAGAQHVSVRILKTQPYSVTHTKIVSDGKEAVLLGSPFEQVYFDAPSHAIDDFRRGENAAKGPIHDVSIAVRGPAVGHIQEVFNTHWNLAGDTDQLDVPPKLQLPEEEHAAKKGEFLSSVQVVRTLNGGTFPGGGSFPDEPKGEKGILEAHLRAIHFAERFIYIENQYFTNEAITEAIIARLKTNDQLQLILLVPVEPDIPRYPHWQKGLIQSIAKSLGSQAEHRFGAFTLWSHSAADAQHPKPRLRANYAHTKTAVIDNNWATVGSANLDGASLDFFQLNFYWRLPNLLLQGGEMRNTETNCVVFEEQLPAGGSAVDALRRRLWAEHLGFLAADGTPDTATVKLAEPSDNDWLKVWRDRAEEKRVGLATGDPNDVKPIRVLPFPLDTWFVNPKRHLKALKVDVSKYDLVEKGPPSRAFRFGP